MKTLLNKLLGVLALGLAVACTGGGDDGADGSGVAAPVPYGPENSWSHAVTADVPSDLDGTGWRAGDVAHNWTLTDQYGEEVELYQFYGSVVVIDNFTEW